MTEQWRPTASLKALAVRARMLARIRTFFAERDVLEVETPALSCAATPDPNLLSFVTRYTGPGAPDGRTLYLHTSPEFAMKRLLAAGAGSIYQICKVFRDGESGRRHNPEFTMLEWYRTGFDHHQLMDDVSALVCTATAGELPLAAAEKLSYRAAFERYAGLDPHRATVDDFARAAAAHDIVLPAQHAHEPDHAVWRDLLLTHVIERKLGQGRPTFLYDFPAAQAALARVLPGDPPVAARFELYINGVELANGFHELTDSAEQRLRFQRQLHTRAAMGLPVVPIDEQFVAALAAGLPDCAGVALGFDRLVMLACQAQSIEDVIAIPLERA